METIVHRKLQVCLSDLFRVTLGWLFVTVCIYVFEIEDEMLCGYTFGTLVWHAIAYTVLLAVVVWFLDLILPERKKVRGKKKRHAVFHISSTTNHIDIENRGTIHQLSTGKDSSQTINEDK